MPTIRALFLVVVLAVAAGCSSAPERSERGASEAIPQSGTGYALVQEAMRYIGTPYKYGGDTPAKGFDCSGLVFYTHRLHGLSVPRTAAEQSAAARPVDPDELKPGDLVFFRINSRKVDHVGIYAGKGRFIHAPNKGRVVSFAYLDDPYYRKRLKGAGRFW